MAEESWSSVAEEEAKDLVESYMDDIVEMLTDDGEVSDDTNRHYSGIEDSLGGPSSLLDAAQVLTDLSRYEETDSGLWDGVDDPQEAVKIQASFTYRNKVMSDFIDYISEINDDVGPAAVEAMEGRQRLERQRDAAEELDDRDDTKQAQIDDLNLQIESFDVMRERRLKDLVLVAIGRKKKPQGPKDWFPGRS